MFEFQSKIIRGLGLEPQVGDEDGKTPTQITRGLGVWSPPNKKTLISIITRYSLARINAGVWKELFRFFFLKVSEYHEAGKSPGVNITKGGVIG